jgi:hypothetical protein
VRCITLACYVMKELESYATQDGLAREQWFENVKPVPWANLPPHLWAMFNDKFYAVFPPYLVLSFIRAFPSILISLADVFYSSLPMTFLTSLLSCNLGTIRLPSRKLAGWKTTCSYSMVTTRHLASSYPCMRDGIRSGTLEKSCSGSLGH